jgi:hypothetical protein
MFKASDTYFCCDGSAMVDNSIAVAQGGYTNNSSPNNIRIYNAFHWLVKPSRNMSIIILDLA